MKILHTNTGPFSERPYYSLAEIEQVTSEALKSVDLYPDTPQAIRIERLIEKKYHITPSYDKLPEGILGFTKFSANGVEEILISRELADNDDKVSVRRLNTTLAHETGHALLHLHLFLSKNSDISLFEESSDVDKTKILCRNESIAGMETNPGKRYDGRWWEFQANSAMSSLLLPKKLVNKALEKFLIITSSFGKYNIPDLKRNKAIQDLSDIFDVNPIVARIRIEELYPVNINKQMEL